ncbi:hypothetical protein ACHHYP_09099 [Achlya hypogyna]|uniref:Secreted protein n=1 Tax=Achlya hypogyna TaxID=1202772 RepID=A0A0A7CNV0_ACHHY|nr:secreted protein [Achlya hypogyna]OQR87356.1 hypothetical protein ACHHYP_09099 [Achlya hypogyna]
MGSATTATPRSSAHWLLAALLVAVLAALAHMQPSAPVHRWLLTTPAFKLVTVYDNGASIGGVAISVSADKAVTGGALAAHLSKYVNVSGLRGETSAIADRVYTGNGILVESYDNITAGDRLYLVAPELLFVWPFVKPGHRVFIEPTQSPTGRPLILESWTESPRVFHVHNFFAEAEADVLIHQVLEKDEQDVAEHEKLRPSTVGSNTEGVRKSAHRTSENAFDSTSEAAVAFRKRSFDLLRVGDYDPAMCDGLQILRYSQKQAYVPHTDYFSSPPTAVWNTDPHTGGTNRFATIFLYLSNVTRGGQTVFPESYMPEGWTHPDDQTSGIEAIASSLFNQTSWEHEMTLKCHSRLASYPKKAHAILFYSQKPNGELDKASLHGGCPVLDGTKWGANLWVWNKKRHVAPPTDRIRVKFENPTEMPVGLFWKGKLMTTLQPHQSHTYNTFPEHPWSMKDAEGNVLLSTIIRKADGPDQHVHAPV